MIRIRGVEAYLPVRKVRRVIVENGKPEIIYEDKPLLSNIVFAYGTEDRVEPLMRGDDKIDCVTPYYDHFKKNKYGRNEYLTVDYEQMMNFIKVIETKNENIILANPLNKKLREGQLVRIIDGQFKGITGHVARYKGQQRVFVSLDNVCLVGTAYVPSYILEPLE